MGAPIVDGGNMSEMVPPATERKALPAKAEKKLESESSVISRSGGCPSFGARHAPEDEMQGIRICEGDREVEQRESAQADVVDL